jgi:hypothetical protein
VQKSCSGRHLYADLFVHRMMVGKVLPGLDMGVTMYAGPELGPIVPQGTVWDVAGCWRYRHLDSWVTELLLVKLSPN